MKHLANHLVRICGVPKWCDSESLCAVSDDDRHLGHILRARGWQAFDSTKLNETGDSYRYIGTFPNKRQAKEAVMNSVVTSSRPLVMTA
jgi:hypothetical protein